MAETPNCVKHLLTLFSIAFRVFYELHPMNIKNQGEDPRHLTRFFSERDYTIFDINLGGQKEEDLLADNDTWSYIEKLAIKRTWVDKIKKAGYRINGGSLVVAPKHD